MAWHVSALERRTSHGLACERCREDDFMAWHAEALGMLRLLAC